MTSAMHVLRLFVHARSRQPVLLLGEDGGDRCVPVFLRPPQAEVIAAGPRGEESVPIPLDVLFPVVEALGRTLRSVEITDLVDGVYTAELVFDDDTRLSVLPSDALALAVREQLPIAMADHVLEEAGQPDPGEPADKQVREFREFIDEVTPDDFR
ncbi:bifunctional nuclease family protein [Pseudonocardia phyllosphaerae]|uniref:bifunctional nuclease family protein n=1 Tax=Pseudonocardia phyllosphaerae TaxID=3390502 RepID=UPI00397AFE66